MTNSFIANVYDVPASILVSSNAVNALANSFNSSDKATNRKLLATIKGDGLIYVIGANYSVEIEWAKKKALAELRKILKQRGKI